MPLPLSLPLAALVALAQAPSEPRMATVQVMARDIPGDPMAGVRLTLEGNQRGLTSETNELGLASFGSLPLGKYRLKAEKEGFRTQVQEVALEAEGLRKLEIRMVKETPAPAKKAHLDR
ncbi:MAG: carboxypeptidase-like regulatory domain-containing protein [Holophagaceae bacterium]